MTRPSMLDKPLTETRRLAAAAGSRHNRRGSVLVLVVGILALMAIIVVVYTTIGQADARAGRVMVAKARLEDQSRAIGDYINGLIGANAAAVFPQNVTADASLTLTPLSVRQGWDYPSTDPEARSIVFNPPAGVTVAAAQAAARRFNPVGTLTTLWNPSWNAAADGPLDPRISSDPWLASTEPTWINHAAATLSLPTPQELLTSQRHWLHMSVVGPDGRPVNLALLRGNFNAPSGFSANPYAPADPQPISDFVYKLADLNPAAPGTLSVLTASSFREIPRSGGVNGEEYNNPYTWSTNQMEVFRPVDAGMNGGLTLSLGDVRHLSNLFADADGDGFYDAYWQELVDASDALRPVSLLPAGGMRFFVAPRIIDLSGLVNLNTATSFSTPPSQNYPAGLTPSDVDLERLLSTADVRQYFGIDPRAAGAIVDPAAGALGRMQTLAPADLTSIGRAGFAALLWSRVDVDGSNPYLSAATPFVFPVTTDGVDLSTGLYGTGLYAQRLREFTGNQRVLTAGARAELYTFGGRDPRDGSFDRLAGGSATQYGVWSGGSFGMGDEKEFRAYGSINDPSMLSRAEVVLDSRWADNPLVGPLRSGRDKQTERDLSLISAAAAAANYPQSTYAMMTQFSLDVRHLLTTVSGARPIKTSAAPVAPGSNLYARSLAQGEVRPDVNLLIATVCNSAETDANRNKALYEIFDGYASALMPLAGMTDALTANVWQTGDLNKPALTVSYGGGSYKADGASENPATAGVFKGRAAEFAHRSAAFMTLNLLSWRDDGRYTSPRHPATDFGADAPLAATLLIDESFRATLNSPQVSTTPGATAERYPWWRAAAIDAHAGTLPGNSGPRSLKLDLNAGQTVNHLLAIAPIGATEEAQTPRAMNLYAARPQPFLTQVASFVMYTDAPASTGGDDGPATRGSADGEWMVDIPDPADPSTFVITSLGVTINGTPSVSTNTDFLCQVVAFQITNPFEVDLQLSTGGPAASRQLSHYLEFGGQTYDLAEYNADDLTTPPGQLTIPAHGSRVFYALSQNPAAIATRWTRAGAAGSSALDVQQWISKQLNIIVPGTINAVRIAPFNPVDSTPIAVTGNLPLLDKGGGNGMTDSNRQALLWKRVVLTGETAAANDIENDYLVDRLADSRSSTQQPTLYRNLPDGQNRFAAIPAGPEVGSPFHRGPGDEQQNTGYSIVLWGTLKRRLDPDGGPLPGGGWTAGFPRGALPAYCVEAKNGSGFDSPGAGGLNVQGYNANLAEPRRAGTTLNPSFFSTQSNEGGRTLRLMLNKQKDSGPNGRYINQALTQHPSQRPIDSGTLANRMDDVNNFDNQHWKTDHLATQLPVVPRRTIAAGTAEPKQPPLRPADLLLPWAIGPYELPGNSGFNYDTTLTATDRHDKLAKRWTTLSEAMGFGLNYSRANDDKTIERQLGHALDNCRLALHRYVPFNDMQPDGMWGGPGAGSTYIDPSMIRGIPAALAVLDQFRTLPYGTLNSPVYGLVNINTAPLSVLRMLPMLFPHSPDVLNPGDRAGFDQHWDNSTAARVALKLNGAAEALWGTAFKYYDPAATLVAYRDKLAVVARGEFGAESGAGRTTVIVDAHDTNDTGLPNGGDTNTTAQDANGRRVLTGVINSHEIPGFRSPGEVMMAVVRGETRRFTNTDLNTPNNNPVKRGLSIDRQTFDPRGTGYETVEHPPASTPGVTAPPTYPPKRDPQPLGASAMTLVDRSTPGSHRYEANRTVGTYEQKLAIANALLNTISVRSDLFCAYFLVNGYQPGDVEGVEPFRPANAGAPSDLTDERYTRPMVPSVQRRYMMIVDRSNCVQAGDKPRILLFEELPVK